MPDPSEPSVSPASPKKKAMGKLLSLGIFFGAVALAFFLLSYNESYPRTDDAYVQARYITVSSEVPGRITELSAKDGMAVSPGDLLVEINPETYALMVEEMSAQITALEAELREAERQRKASLEMVEVARANTERSVAMESLAQSTYERMTPLAEQGFVTQERYDTTSTNYEQAQAAVLAAKSNELAAELAVPDLASLRAELGAARISLKQAEVELARTRIVAPFEGRVVNCDYAPGMMVMPGEPLFTLVDIREWFVMANYREGDLKNIAVGDKARVRLLSLPDRVYEGTVVSIGYAVQTQDAYSMGPLPTVRNNLDWVRTAQRFPVRIRIDKPEPETAFRMGVSATVTIEKP